jgi:hypothetical protein
MVCHSIISDWFVPHLRAAVGAAVAAWAAWELEQCLDPKREKRWKNAGFDPGNFGENVDFTYEKWVEKVDFTDFTCEKWLENDAR